jgi:GWxTD domain-containing protein
MAIPSFSGRMFCFLQAAIVVFFAASPGAQSIQNEQGSSRTASGLPAIYQRWLDDDVRWIISRAERTAFVRLANNEQRDHFVEQFWLHRDPTPATSENEFKEEHYRRIAYANLHFQEAVRGQDTDRGRIYIVYGPPDLIKSESSNGDQTEAVEIWHFRSIPAYGNADLRFVDVCRCGDYRLETAPEK